MINDKGQFIIELHVDTGFDDNKGAFRRKIAYASGQSDLRSETDLDRKVDLYALILTLVFIGIGLIHADSNLTLNLSTSYH